MATNLAAQVADALVEAIASGALQPGDRVIEAEIAAELGVSRLPVREAMKTLATQGIVELSIHRGGRVVEIDQNRIDSLRDARIALERLAVVKAGRVFREDPRQLDILDALIATMADAAARRDWSAGNVIDIAFHREIIRISGDPILITLWETLARQVRIIFGWETRARLARKGLVKEHLELRTALSAGDSVALSALIETHIRGPQKQEKARREVTPPQRPTSLRGGVRRKEGR